MRNIASFTLFVAKSTLLDVHHDICARTTLLTEGSRVDTQNRVHNLDDVSEISKISEISDEARLTLAKGFNTLGRTSTSGRAFQNSPSLR
jgi:hypothetical protein